VQNVGRGFKISYESPKSENLELFHLGEKAYDHVLILPIKLKGNTQSQIPSSWSNLKQVLDQI
jgi:hypothetical protein